MATEGEQFVKDLADEVERLRGLLKDQDEKIKKQDDAIKNVEPRPIMMLSGRRLDRFRDRPSTSSDPTISEWVADMRSQAATRKFTDPDFASFLIDNLAGKARQEILGRGDAVKNNPEAIIKVLFKVFGDGDNLPLLQQRFYAYKQKDEDLVTCSLNMVEIYDKIVQLDASFGACRDASLKGRFAEAVKDESLKRELRRLNIELPDQTFFELRDRAVHWIGRTSDKALATNQEMTEICDKNELSNADIIKRQEEMIRKQQRQIDSLLRNTTIKSKQYNGYQKKRLSCWNCGSFSHLQRNCPKAKQEGAKGDEDLNE